MLDNFKVKIYNLLQEDEERSFYNAVTEYFISFMICLNVILIILESFDFHEKYDMLFLYLRWGFFVFFLLEYIARLWIADYLLHDNEHPITAKIRYIFSFTAIINLLALLPNLLGNTIIDFRIFRILRLFRVTQIKVLREYTYILENVIKLKGKQLLVSLFIAIIFSLICAVIIYDLENAAQPDVFGNVLDGLWWAISSITTIGYGDMYPITPLGKLLGSFMSIFGVFLMAVPIGILTAGFFEISKNYDDEDCDRDNDNPKTVEYNSNKKRKLS